jgi:hypothetical protein
MGLGEKDGIYKVYVQYKRRRQVKFLERCTCRTELDTDSSFVVVRRRALVSVTLTAVKQQHLQPSPLSVARNLQYTREAVHESGY